MKSQLNERAGKEVLQTADTLVQHILAGLPVDEMRNNRGQNYGQTAFYQIRVKPTVKGSIPLADLLLQIEKYLRNAKSGHLGISNVQINDRSVNSGKYSSVSFTVNGIDYDVVAALGGNSGESFEKELLLKMDNLVATGSGAEDGDQARAAFSALEEVDPLFELDNIVSVSPRSGSTQRSGNLTPEETGEIIADIVVHLKVGGKKYVSVKNALGGTVAQFGISKAFNDDLSVNTRSNEWRTWLEPFGLSPEKIEEGLRAAKDQTEVEWNDIETQSVSVDNDHPIFRIMQQMWGANYYYLREKRGGFYAIKIDRQYVDNVILGGLRVTEIRYPSKNRKQINIYLQSDFMKFKLEARNPRGKGSAKPTQIQLTVMKGTVG